MAAHLAPLTQRSLTLSPALRFAVYAVVSVAILVGRASAETTAIRSEPTAPAFLSQAEVHVYRERPGVEVYVFKPKGWQASDRRAALVFYFGGGWVRGGPETCGRWARLATSLGMVGILPDYRTRERFGTTPLETVADARAAMRWVQEHAQDLGIATNRIVAGGSSSGGHLAIWTAIGITPPGSDPDEAPLMPPAALLLFCPSPDTTDGHRAKLFGVYAEALSALEHMEKKMPPTLMFHGDADTIVPYRIALAYRDKAVRHGNRCELVTVPAGTHRFLTNRPEWNKKLEQRTTAFLSELGLVEQRDQ